MQFFLETKFFSIAVIFSAVSIFVVSHFNQQDFEIENELEPVRSRRTIPPTEPETHVTDNDRAKQLLVE